MLSISNDITNDDLTVMRLRAKVTLEDATHTQGVVAGTADR